MVGKPIRDVGHGACILYCTVPPHCTIENLTQPSPKHLHAKYGRASLGGSADGGVIISK